MQEYGTLEPVVVEKRSRSKYAVVFAAVMLCAVFAAFSFTSSAQVNSAVNSNKDKANYSPVAGRDIVEKLIEGEGRGVVFRFTPDKSMIVPVVTLPASSDLKGDWKAFTGAFPEEELACGVYNFPFWADDYSLAQTSVLFTWAPENIDPREVARAGYFMGSAVLLSKGVEHVVSLESTDATYMDACRAVAGSQDDDSVTEANCDLEGEAHGCPFRGEGTPCEEPACDGASFIGDGSPGSVSDDCCDAMQSFCDIPVNSQNLGCHVVVKTSWERRCSDFVESPPIVAETGMVTPEMIEVCEDKCANPCSFLEQDEEGASYKYCSGCDSSKGCSSFAYGFKTQSCCGILENDVCAGQTNEFECSEIEGCSFVPHLECTKVKDDLYREASPYGCCSTEEGNREAYTPQFQYDCDKLDGASFKELTCDAHFEEDVKRIEEEAAAEAALLAEAAAAEAAEAAAEVVEEEAPVEE